MKLWSWCPKENLVLPRDMLHLALEESAVPIDGPFLANKPIAWYGGTALPPEPVESGGLRGTRYVGVVTLAGIKTNLLNSCEDTCRMDIMKTYKI